MNMFSAFQGSHTNATMLFRAYLAQQNHNKTKANHGKTAP
jgi:hypothetical protein